MFKKIIGAIFCVAFTSIASAQDNYFLLNPTLSPDANTIVFSYDGDLWKVPAQGGEAIRLTAMDGEETLPRISPDGKWLAFSATQYGNQDIYLMPMGGGKIKQLTYHDGTDDVDSWSWDSEHIYFTSSRSNRFTGYQVSIKGDTPKKLFDHYFNNMHNIAAHPTTGELFFNESWESKFFTHRKRYKGAYNPDIKSYNPVTDEYKEYTHYNGKDMWATLDQKGALYFASDEANGEYNLYTFKEGTKTALTSFETSIGRPQVSANGEALVFSKDYQIFLYNVQSNSTVKVPIQLVKNNTLSKTQDFNVKGKITNYTVSPDNKKLAFISRGELFVSDIKGKFIQQIKTKSGERVTEIAWLKDNKTLLYNRTYKGYSNIFSILADGKGTEKQHTKELRNNVNIELDADLEKALYISGRDELRVLDLKNYKSEVVVKDEFWALYAPQPHFSPNGSHIVYSAIRNFERDLFVIRLADKKIINLTQTGVSEVNPVWSPDGKYIYFASNLTKPGYPYGLRESRIYRMALDKYEEPYALDKYAELFKEEEPEDKDDEKDKKKDKKEDEKEEKKTPITIKINEKGLMDRLERISPSFGRQNNPHIIFKDETTHVVYLSNHDQGKTKLWKTSIKPFEKNKTEKIVDENTNSYYIVAAKDKHYILMKGAIHTLDIEKNSTEKIEMDYTFRRNLSEEFIQMFHEAWAGFEENFYDADFHGEDWTALRDKYAEYLPYLTNRSQLRLLFNDMLGELNTSHFGFNSNGKEETRFHKSRTLATGIKFSEDNPYVVQGIIADGPADISGKNIRKGDVLVAVNGVKITPDNNRESYFMQPSLDKELQLTFKRNNKPVILSFHPISSGNQRTLLYDEWIDHNQAYVDQKSDKKVAYIHMKNMGHNSLENFKREMVSEANNRKALILDLRYNTGGNVHDEVLQFLSQKPYLNWKYREGQLASQPNFTPAAKPIIILINEQSLSDAEMTSAGFKALGLGKLIGTETYRWIVFTSGNRLVDGSSYRLPSWGCYTLDGKNLEKEGVAPDIHVDKNFEDRIKGRQPQLDSALSEITKQLN
ncbi:MAG: peptidase S41 [Flavobacteriaceae bacterium]|nr:MAG: peptidase S41 [Flavobacteriaceae bacterium]